MIDFDRLDTSWLQYLYMQEIETNYKKKNEIPCNYLIC